MIAFALIASYKFEINKLRTYSEAVKSEKSEECKKAMDEEMHSLIKNYTWDLIERRTKKSNRL